MTSTLLGVRCLWYWQSKITLALTDIASQSQQDLSQQVAAGTLAGVSESGHEVLVATRVGPVIHHADTAEARAARAIAKAEAEFLGSAAQQGTTTVTATMCHVELFHDSESAVCLSSCNITFVLAAIADDSDAEDNTVDPNQRIVIKETKNQGFVAVEENANIDLEDLPSALEPEHDGMVKLGTTRGALRPGRLGLLCLLPSSTDAVCPSLILLACCRGQALLPVSSCTQRPSTPSKSTSTPTRRPNSGLLGKTATWRTWTLPRC